MHLERFAVSKAPPAGAGGTVTFAKSGKSIFADAATSLMDAGEQLGVQMPFGCRMGICQSCVVTLAEGHVTRPAQRCWIMSRGPAFKPAFPLHRAIAHSTSEGYSLVTYGFVGYDSVGQEL